MRTIKGSRIFIERDNKVRREPMGQEVPTTTNDNWVPTSGEVWLGDAGLLVPGPAGHTAAAHQPEHDDGNLGLL